MCLWLPRLHFGPRLDLFVCRFGNRLRDGLGSPGASPGGSLAHCCAFISMSINWPRASVRSNPFMLPPSLQLRLTNSRAIYCIASVIICNLLSHTLNSRLGGFMTESDPTPKWSTATGPGLVPVPTAAPNAFPFWPNHSLMP